MRDLKSIVKELADNCIEDVINSNQEGIGLQKGYASSLLLLGELHRFTSDEKYVHMFQAVLDDALKDESMLIKDPSLMYGCSGFLWVLTHLKKENIIDLDMSIFLEKMDNILRLYVIDTRVEEYDYFSGYLGVLQYFLSRPQTRENINVLQLITDKLLENKLENNGYITWSDYQSTHFFNQQNKTSIKNRSNFGLAHGIPGILMLLCNVLAVDNSHYKRIKQISLASVDYLISHKNTSEEVSLFPCFDFNKKGENNSRMAWCYGDLGVLLSLLKVKETFNSTKYDDIIGELIKIINFRTLNHLVKDACLCHGSAGNWMILSKLKSEVKNINLDKSIAFQQKLFESWWFSDNKMKYHGIKYGNQGFHSDNSFLSGTLGTLLCLISIDSKNYNWTKCINLI